jgi:putative photosynthetic complex assembly protein 2
VSLLLAFAFVALMWFFSTGAILWLCRLPRTAHQGAIVAATPLAGVAVCALIVSAGETGASAAYLAFTAALALWGWHEMSFLMGFVSGPRRSPCPEGLSGWARFRASTETVIHHELALAATLAFIVAITWGQPNQTGALTFGILFAMRISAKLNIFLGVPNLSAELIPPHLHYLTTYFRRRPMNPLFPLSVAGSLALAVVLAADAMTSPAAALLLALTLLGLAEHVLMMLPVRDAALWDRFTNDTMGRP